MAKRKSAEEPQRAIAWRPLAWLLGAVVLAGAILITALRVDFAVRGVDKPAIVQVAASRVEGCSLARDKQRFPEMMRVEAGEYLLPTDENGRELMLHLKPLGMTRVTQEQPFLLQRSEVTIEQFGWFVKAINDMSDGPRKEQLLAIIGLHWDKTDPKNLSKEGYYGGSASPAARAISREGARAFIDWLNERTGCRYHLPTRNQWAAAVISQHLASGQPASAAEANDGGVLGGLLRGVREWSDTGCANGFFLLGHDQWTTEPNVGVSACMPGMLSVAGFRLARELDDGS
ncbi:hypothetical protein MAIT1_00117 [Magnetofaba australis IT-1]|uniref:Sulfatase-modifying factor enzyme-like domain-containing protein n=2 Tax=Magnetofaba TaxID=1472292 RepID=A0A1Y2KAZ8_9PROT|nr:hypothetical protein MAIT1_00117 [Magnetofaba australis IT-1]